MKHDAANNFPKRMFDDEDIQKARRLIDEGYKHRLRVRGSPQFIEKVQEALDLIKMAKYYSFLRTYIKEIIEVDGLSQLREVESSIWVNQYTIADALEAAGYLVQKTEQMKNYVEGKPYFGGVGESNAVEKRIEFLEELRKRSKSQDVQKRCEEALTLWAESKFL